MIACAPPAGGPVLVAGKLGLPTAVLLRQRRYCRKPACLFEIDRNAPVAQLDRVSGYEPEGREFESLQARQLSNFHQSVSVALLTRRRPKPCGCGSFARTLRGRERVDLRSILLRMRWIVSLAIFVPLVGCTPSAQPESARTVAAYEVPLQSEADRNQFLAVLRSAAQAEGMHVDSAK